MNSASANYQKNNQYTSEKILIDEDSKQTVEDFDQQICDMFRVTLAKNGNFYQPDGYGSFLRKGPSNCILFIDRHENGGYPGRQSPNLEKAMMYPSSNHFEQLPVEWSTETDSEGRVYYYNKLTSVSQWNPPTNTSSSIANDFQLNQYRLKPVQYEMSHPSTATLSHGKVTDVHLRYAAITMEEANNGQDWTRDVLYRGTIRLPNIVLNAINIYLNLPNIHSDSSVPHIKNEFFRETSLVVLLDKNNGYLKTGKLSVGNPGSGIDEGSVDRSPEENDPDALIKIHSHPPGETKGLFIPSIQDFINARCRQNIYHFIMRAASYAKPDKEVIAFNGAYPFSYYCVDLHKPTTKTSGPYLPGDGTYDPETQEISYPSLDGFDITDSNEKDDYPF